MVKNSWKCYVFGSVLLVLFAGIVFFGDSEKSDVIENVTVCDTVDIDVFREEFDRLNESYILLVEDFNSWIATKEELISSCISEEGVFKEWYAEKLSSYNPSTELGFSVNIFDSTIKIDYPGGTDLGFVNMWCSTKSMNPTLGCDDKVFGYVPRSPSEINVGDIVMFKENFYDVDNTVHRVIAIEEVGGETFYTTAGDNQGVFIEVDSQKVSFRDVRLKILGVVYG